MTSSLPRSVRSTAMPIAPVSTPAPNIASPKSDTLATTSFSSSSVLPSPKSNKNTAPLLKTEGSSNSFENESNLSYAPAIPNNSPPISNQPSQSGGVNSAVLVAIILSALLLMGGLAIMVFVRRVRRQHSKASNDFFSTIQSPMEVKLPQKQAKIATIPRLRDTLIVQNRSSQNKSNIEDRNQQSSGEKQTRSWVSSSKIRSSNDPRNSSTKTPKHSSFRSSLRRSLFPPYLPLRSPSPQSSDGFYVLQGTDNFLQSGSPSASDSKGFDFESVVIFHKEDKPKK